MCMAVALLALAGCGGKSDEPAKVMKCSMNQAESGIKMDLQIDFEYDGNQVLRQIQKGSVTVDSDDMMPQVVQFFESAGYKEITKDMKGVEYEIVEDNDKREVIENLTIDFDKISATDYSKVTNGQVNASGSKFIVALDKTEEGMTKQGYTCTK